MKDIPAQELINYQQAKIERQEKIIELQAKRIKDLELAEQNSVINFAEKLKTKIADLEAKSPNEAYKCGMEDVLYYHMPKIIDEVLKEYLNDENNKSTD